MRMAATVKSLQMCRCLVLRLVCSFFQPSSLRWLLLCMAGLGFGFGAGCLLAQPTNGVTFYVGSDLHYGYTNGAFSSAELCRATAGRMKRLPGNRYPSLAGGGIVDAPRGVLLVGDLTEMGRLDQWQAFTNDWRLNGDGCVPYPVYEAYGNHDTYGDNIVPDGIRLRNLVRPGLSNLSSNGFHYSLDWDALHVVCLNLFPGSNSVGEVTCDARDSFKFLVADLAKNVGNSGRPVVLYHHYGLDGFSMDWWTSPLRAFYFEALKPYNVIGIFSGHNHNVDFIPWLGLNTYNDGTMGKMAGNFFAVHVTRDQLVVCERTAADTWGNTFIHPISFTGSPIILTNPAPVAVAAGAKLVLEVAALGPTLQYQWFYNGTNLPGATNSTLILENVRRSASGAYGVLVSNLCGVTSSAPATASVTVGMNQGSLPVVVLPPGPHGTNLCLEYRDTLSPTSAWTLWTNVPAGNAEQYCPVPLPMTAACRLYRLTSTTLRVGIKTAPTVVVMGDVGDSIRVEYQTPFAFGTNWTHLATVTLTNFSQIIFDPEAITVSNRIYRVQQLP